MLVRTLAGLDRDGDGSLSVGELATFVRALGPSNNAHATPNASTRLRMPF